MVGVAGGGVGFWPDTKSVGGGGGSVAAIYREMRYIAIKCLYRETRYIAINMYSFRGDFYHTCLRELIRLQIRVN